MLLLETPNRIISDTLQNRLSHVEGDGSRADPVDITCAEFDDVQYHITSSMDEPHLVTVSIKLPNFAELKDNGLDGVIADNFGAMVTDTEEGHDFTLRVDLKDLPSDKAKVIDAIASMKRHLFSAPFHRIFDAVGKGETPDVTALKYRPNETLWLVPQKDQIVVIFAVEFRDPTDIPIAKVFLQEFAEARRQAGLGSAPPVSYTDDVPLELKGLNVETSATKSFVSFVVFPRNFERGAKRDTTINMLHQFRDYLHYHIKASKAYMHTRMRARVASWLKVLKQAVPEHAGGEKEKKTASGRTFVRK